MRADQAELGDTDRRHVGEDADVTREAEAAGMGKVNLPRIGGHLC
jgi:hypothetical protein